VIIDLFFRIATGWPMSKKPVADLVVSALNMAVWNRRPHKELTHLSDHGSQYTSLVFSQRLEDPGLLGSMSTVGIGGVISPRKRLHPPSFHFILPFTVELQDLTLLCIMPDIIDLLGLISQKII